MTGSEQPKGPGLSRARQSHRRDGQLTPDRTTLEPTVLDAKIHPCASTSNPRSLPCPYQQPPHGLRASGTKPSSPTAPCLSSSSLPEAATTRPPTPQDELYIIMKGSGTLKIEDTRFPFVQGDVLFVPAGKRHRFVDFTPDLITWAIFW